MSASLENQPRCFLHRCFERAQRLPLLGGHLGLLAVVLGYSIVFWSRSSFIPLWDGWEYANECILRGVQKPFSVKNFGCFGHPSFAYASFVALWQYLDPGNHLLMHLADWLLGVLGVCSFYAVARKLFAGTASRRELALLTAVFAFMPLFLATGLNPNPDYGVIVFLMAFLASLLWGHPVLAVLSGLALVFSKEPGVLVCSAAAAAFVALNVPVHTDRPWAKTLHLLRHAYLIVPPASFLYYLKARISDPATAGWGPRSADDVQGLIRQLTSFSLTEKSFHAFLKGALLANFNWILTLLVVAHFLHWAWQCFWRERAIRISRRHWFAVALFVVSVFLLTRYPTWTNVRYVAVLGSLLTLAAYGALCHWLTRERQRVRALASFVGLIGISNWFTIDPVSTHVLYETFQFGERRMLSVAAGTSEWSGPGRDQLQYSLQFSFLNDALNAVFATIDPEANVFVANDTVNWWVMTPLLRSSRQRTLRLKDTINPRFMDVPTLLRQPEKPAEIRYIAFPNIGYGSLLGDLSSLATVYRTTSVQRVGRGGFYVEVHSMTLGAK